MLSVPVTLEDVLKRMRRADVLRFLWADAMCINQHDVRERGQQVQFIIGLIYSIAECMLAPL